MAHEYEQITALTPECKPREHTRPYNMLYYIAINRDMTHISRKELDPKMRAQLMSQFTEIFATANKKQLTLLFEALFTDAEKVMFIKRVAVVLLLREGYSTYAVAKTLKISDSTVRALSQKYEEGHYDAIVGAVRRKEFDTQQFWKTLEVLLRAGLPPQGKGRWKWLK